MTRSHWPRGPRLVGALVALVLSAGHVEGAQATPPRRPGDSGELKSHDLGASLAGVGTYLGVSIAGGLLVIPAAMSGSQPLGRAGVVAGAGLLMAGPAIAGGLVCAIENRNERYQSTCTLPIVGAYAGLFLGSGILLATAGDGRSSLLIPGLAVALVLPALGAVTGWHVGKSERVEAPVAPPASTDAPPVFAPEAAQRRLSLLDEPTLTFPLVAGRF
jgi:hypothetical protein